MSLTGAGCSPAQKRRGTPRCAFFGSPHPQIGLVSTPKSPPRSHKGYCSAMADLTHAVKLWAGGKLLAAENGHDTRAAEPPATRLSATADINAAAPRMKISELPR